MGPMSRERLQATHVTCNRRSPLKPVGDSGTKGYQKKLLLQMARLTTLELGELSASRRSKSSHANLLVIVEAVKNQFRDVDAHVAGLAGLDSSFINQVIAKVTQRRDAMVPRLAGILKAVETTIAKNKKELLNGSALACLEWALANMKIADQIRWIIEVAHALGLRLQKLKLSELLPALVESYHLSKSAMTNAQTTLRSEPVGYLHLEKLEFTPDRTVRGELVYSVPLAPGEEVNITNREWAQKTEEFEKIVTDYLEDYSEEGVTEKNELTDAVSSQTQHSMAFNTGLSVSGTYGPVTATATASLAIQDSASESANESRNKSVELTHKASSRAKRDHKVSFRIASVTEREQLRVQTFTNPSSSRAARVDYYQTVRAWNVRLFRYGARLTWDIMVPEPASDLLGRLEELAEIRRRLQVPFTEFFTLTAGELTLDNYADKASHFGVAIATAPLVLTRDVLVTDQRDWSTTGGGYTTSYTVDIVIPDGYVATSSVLLNYVADRKDSDWGILVDDISSFPKVRVFSLGSEWSSITRNSISTWQGRDGVLKLFVLAWDVKHWAMSVRVTCNAKPESISAWKMAVWEEIRQAVQSRYYEERQTLKTRLEELESELAAEDALSLRRREREEIMKGVLRWLGVQGHEFYPSGLPEQLYGDSGGLYDPATGLISDIAHHNQLVAHGDKIRFLHQAIEWENVLYFLYPYFWIHPARWQDKLNLDHPDPVHRAFLKAGSCRVVLTVRPDFEDAFLAFINTGDMTSLPPSPYREISDEFKSYAQTNYQGIPPANPVNNFRPLLSWKQRKAWDDVQTITALLDRFHAVRGRYPTQSEGLGALSAHTDSSIPTVPHQDPWGNAYVYRFPGNHHLYDVLSLGADGAEGGEGDAADISNYAEASLIGAWTEYTPTSALDIEFHEL